MIVEFEVSAVINLLTSFQYNLLSPKTMLSQKRTILYVEDHEDTRELVTFVLQDADYQVTSNRTIAEGLEAARSRKFDLYLLDSWLPDGSGLTLCKKIREFDPHTPILFYSAAAFEVDRDTAIRCGAQGYLVKPTHPSELCETVSALVGNGKNGRG